MAAIFDNLTDPKLIKQLQAGAVGVLPTDTVYGLVCIVSDPTAVKRLYSLKKCQHKPGTIIAANIDQLVELGLKRRYLTAVEQFWPGPVSVVLILSDPEKTYLLEGLPDIAVRIPSDKKLHLLLQKTGPLLTTSSNEPNKIPAAVIQEAEVCFGHKVDFYVDGGDLSGRKPSTIIRIVDDAVEVIRPGAVKIGNNGVVK